MQHEFSTTLPMKAAYFCASLASTLSYLTLLVSCFASSLDFINLTTDELSFREHTPFVLEVNRETITIVCLLVIYSLSLLSRFIIYKNKTSSQYSVYITKTQNPQGCCTCWQKLKTRMTKFFWSSNSKSFVGNTLKFLNLPTSQYVYKYLQVYSVVHA